MAALNNSDTWMGCKWTTMLVFYAAAGSGGGGNRDFISVHDLVPGDWPFLENAADKTAKHAG